MPFQHASNEIFVVMNMVRLVLQVNLLLGPEVINLVLCSAQLSMKLTVLINTRIAQINRCVRFRSPKPLIYPADKCLNANNCWHFNVYQQDKF